MEDFSKSRKLFSDLLKEKKRRVEKWNRFLGRGRFRNFNEKIVKFQLSTVDHRYGVAVESLRKHSEIDDSH